MGGGLPTPRSCGAGSARPRPPRWAPALVRPKRAPLVGGVSLAPCRRLGRSALSAPRCARGHVRCAQGGREAPSHRASRGGAPPRQRLRRKLRKLGRGGRGRARGCGPPRLRLRRGWARRAHPLRLRSLGGALSARPPRRVGAGRRGRGTGRRRLPLGSREGEPCGSRRRAWGWGAPLGRAQRPPPLLAVARMWRTASSTSGSRRRAWRTRSPLLWIGRASVGGGAKPGNWIVAVRGSRSATSAERPLASPTRSPKVDIEGGSDEPHPRPAAFSPSLRTPASCASRPSRPPGLGTWGSGGAERGGSF